MQAFEAALLREPATLRVGLLFALVAVLTSLLVKRERAHVARLGVAFAGSLALRVVAEGLHLAGLLKGAEAVRFLAQLLEGLAGLGLLGVILFAGLLPLARLDFPRIVRDLAVALSYVGFTFYLLATHKVDVTGIVATSAVVTAVIGFSMQETLSNVMGGVFLQVDGAFGPGDWVKFGDVSGKVREINWRRTSIESRNGDTLVVPNSVLMKSPVLVLGRSTRWPEVKQRRWVWFNVDYRTPPTDVITTVTDAISRAPIPNVAATPEPNVVLMEFKESWAAYAVRYWLTDLLLDDPTDSVIRTRVAYALRRAGIPFSIPAATLFTKAADAERKARHERRQHEERRAALDRVPLFASLTSEERDTLASGLLHAPFVPGEAIVVQGREVHSLYVLTRGSAEVRVSIAGAPPKAITQLTAPDIFGEMGMLTGEPRRATVVALTEVECWRLDKDRFREVLMARPAIARDMSAVLAAREVELAAAREGLTEEAKRRRLETEHGTLFGRIERFFGLG